MSEICGLGFFNADNWELFFEKFVQTLDENEFLNHTFNMCTEGNFKKLGDIMHNE